MKPWQQVFDGFETRLHQWGTEQGVKVDQPTWWVGDETLVDARNVHPRHVFLLSGESDVLVYVKISSAGAGFWGLNPNRLSLLGASERKWSVLLLLESPERGCFIPSGEVQRCTKSLVWKLSSGRNPEFKVHERDIAAEFYFKSFAQLGDRLLASVSV